MKTPKKMFEEIYKEAMANKCFNDALRAADELRNIDAAEKAFLDKKEDGES